MNVRELFTLNNVALIGVATYLLSTIRNWFFALFVFVKRRYIMGVSVSGAYMETKVKEWLINNCYSEGSRKLLTNNNMYLYNEFNKSLMWGSYLIRVRRFCWAYVYSFQIKDSFSGDGVKNMLGVDFYGIGRTALVESVKASFELKRDDDDMIRLVSKLSGAVFNQFTTKEPRTNKKIFGEFVDKVDDAVGNFINNKDIYEKFGRKYKTAILLYGPPGTGKTSIVKHVAESLNLETIYFLEGLLSEGNSPAVIAGSINDDSVGNTDKNDKPCPALCVIEDIDKSILGVGDGDEKEKSRQVAQKGRTVDKLMQFLDSNISPNNIILIITTNNIELLPEPLIRSGRIDHKIYVGPLTRENAEEMCEHYGVKKEEILGDANEFNPADLENKIFTKIMGERNERVQN
jgi:ATP-dependent metallopeptidase hflB3